MCGGRQFERPKKTILVRDYCFSAALRNVAESTDQLVYLRKVYREFEIT